MSDLEGKLDPELAADYRKLAGSVNASCAKKQKFEEHRMKLFKRWVGPDFGGYGCKERRPVNMLELGVDLLARYITASDLEAFVQTEFRELAPTAYDFEIVLNRKLGARDLSLAEAFTICAIESLFTLGVMCTGLRVEAEYDAGKVFAEPVLFPDLIVDMSAKSWQTQSYVGHDFLIAYDDLRDSPLMEGKSRELLLQRRDQRNNRDWEANGSAVDRDEFREMIVLRQLYIPHTNQVIICDPGAESRLPLMTSDWQGPAGGPYTPLYFTPVPGHVVPLAPVPFWYDLDDLINKSFGKAGRQALRSKVVGVTRTPTDAEALARAGDGDIVNVEDVNAIVEKHFGGADQSLLGMLQLSKMLLVYMGGNWDAIGGLAPLSSTASQDQMLTQSASGRVQEMQRKMITFESKVIADIAYWLWTDPLTVERFAKKIQGTRFSVDGEWSPETRQGDFFQYNFSVNPHKRIRRSPEEQSNGLVGLLTQVVLPALPFMQNGSPIDWEQLFELIARYGNWPELRQILRWPQGESLPAQEPEQPRQSPVSHRTYERVNRPGGSRQGQDAALAQFLLGGQPQGAEAASLMQPLV